MAAVYTPPSPLISPSTTPSNSEESMTLNRIPNEIMAKIMTFTPSDHQISLVNKNWQQLNSESRVIGWNEALPQLRKNCHIASFLQEYSLDREILRGESAEKFWQTLCEAIEHKYPIRMNDFPAQIFNPMFLLKVVDFHQHTQNESLLSAWPVIAQSLRNTNDNPNIAVPPNGASVEEIRGWLNNPVHQDLITSVSSLYLSNCGLSVIPDEIRKFTNLQVLSLVLNNIAVLPRGIFNGLKNLQDLNLSRNNLKNLPNDLFKDQKQSLLELNLSNNKLKDLPSDIFHNLENLQVVNLDLNRLQNLSPDIFRNLNNIQWLFLSGNRLQSLPPGIFHNLNHLEGVQLDRNKFISLPVHLFNSTPNLRVIRISEDLIPSLPHNFLTNLSQLEQLDIECSFQSAPSNFLKKTRQALPNGLASPPNPKFSVNHLVLASQVDNASETGDDDYKGHFYGDHGPAIESGDNDYKGHPNGDDYSTIENGDDHLGSSIKKMLDRYEEAPLSGEHSHVLQGPKADSMSAPVRELYLSRIRKNLASLLTERIKVYDTDGVWVKIYKAALQEKINELWIPFAKELDTCSDAQTDLQELIFEKSRTEIKLFLDNFSASVDLYTKNLGVMPYQDIAPMVRTFLLIHDIDTVLGKIAPGDSCEDIFPLECLQLVKMEDLNDAPQVRDNSTLNSKQRKKLRSREKNKAKKKAKKLASQSIPQGLQTSSNTPTSTASAQVSSRTSYELEDDDDDESPAGPSAAASASDSFDTFDPEDGDETSFSSPTGTASAQVSSRTSYELEDDDEPPVGPSAAAAASPSETSIISRPAKTSQASKRREEMQVTYPSQTVQFTPNKKSYETENITRKTTTAQAAQILRNAGFEPISTRGSHQKYKNPELGITTGMVNAPTNSPGVLKKVAKAVADAKFKKTERKSLENHRFS